MTQEALDQLVQDRYREAIETHQSPDIQLILIELRARLEVLERGETIGMGVKA